MRRPRNDRRLRGAERSRLAKMCLLLVMLMVLIPLIRSRPGMFSFLSALTKEGIVSEDPDSNPDDVLPREKLGSPGADPTKSAAAESPAETATAKSTAAKTAEKTSTEKTSTEKTSTEKTGTEKTGVEKTGVEKTGVEKTGVESTASKSSDPSRSAKSANQPSPKSLADTPPPAPLGDEELECARIKELLSVVVDGKEFNATREMPAYFHLLKLARDQSPEVLKEHARVNPKFNDFYHEAAKHRGEVVQVELNVRRIERFVVEEENVADVKEVFELWGWTEEAGAWLYVGITSELPPGMKVGPVEERVTLVGYFFKLQGYQARDAKPNARPMLAPAIIGRVIWKPPPPPQKEPWWLWAALCGICVVVVSFLAVRILGFGRRQPRGKPAAESPARIADWLQPSPAPADESPPRERPAEPSGPASS